MYSNKLVVSIKANGKILREFNDLVLLPFGTEYSIIIKNLDQMRRALVTLILDGDDVCTDGLVVNPNQTIELERWVKNGNLTEGNKFKFIARTQKITDHRGARLEDGLLRVQFNFELNPGYNLPISGTLRGGPFYVHDSHPFNIRQAPPTNYNSNPSSNWGAGDSTMFANCSNLSASSTNISATSSTLSATAQSDIGITVPGSRSTQQFVTVNSFTTDSVTYTMVLKLAGETPDNKPVEAVVTVDTKVKCDTCGTITPMKSKFCSECGTSTMKW